MVEFGFTQHFPWPEPFETSAQWPVPNRFCDPERAVGLIQRYLDQAVAAEACGFDYVNFNEHHFSPYGLSCNGNLYAASLARQTTRIKLELGGNLVPLHNPIRVAEECAALDVLSGGRIIVGIPRGIPHEYIAYGVPPGESYPRMREAWQLIRKAWTEPEPFGWEGEYYRFPAVSIWPPPVQQPHPPVIAAGTSAESVEFAAEAHASIGMPHIPTLEHACRQIDLFREAAERCGWTVGPQDIRLGMSISIADTDAEARRWFEEGENYQTHVLGAVTRTADRLVLEASRYYQREESVRARFQRLRGREGVTLDQRIEMGVVLCGAPSTVAQQIRHLVKRTGAGRIGLNFCLGRTPHEVVDHAMQLFGDGVRPALADL